jgi:hypothetical protein
MSRPPLDPAGWFCTFGGILLIGLAIVVGVTGVCIPC